MFNEIVHNSITSCQSDLLLLLLFSLNSSIFLSTFQLTEWEKGQERTINHKNKIGV